MADSKPAREATSKDVQARFDVQPPAVSRWVKAGCPHDKIKNRTFFNLDEVAAWVKVHRKNLGEVGGDRRSLSYRMEKGTRSEKEKLTAAQDIEMAQARAKLRKDLAAAETAELKLEHMKGQLLSKEEVEQATLSKIARARAVLLGGPSVLAQDTTGDQAHDESLLKEWVHRALTELATEEE